MIGDQGPLFRAAQLPPNPPGPGPVPGIPSARDGNILYPTIRALKVTENLSPVPQDRVFYSFNYFDSVSEALLNRFDAPIDELRVFRHVFGVESTFNEGRGSFGFRLPLHTITSVSKIQGAGGTFTGLGDLNIFAKHILAQDSESGSLVSVGLSVTPPTGPRHFANAPFISSPGGVVFQPFMGYYLNFGDLYIHGFSSFNFSSVKGDAVLIYNDVGLVYYLMRDENPNAFITAIAPTFEVHVNNPLNNRDVFNESNPFGLTDSVNLVSALNIEFAQTSRLALGIVNSVVHPRPFDFEVVALFDIRLGGSRGQVGPFSLVASP